MKTLHASVLFKLIKEGKLKKPTEVITCIGPETDLVLLLTELRQLKSDFSALEKVIMEDIFMVMCFQYPEKAVEYLRNMNSEYVLEEILNSPATIDLNTAYNYEENTDNNLVTDMKYKILRDFIYEVCIPKFKKFFENKTVLALSVTPLSLFKDILFKEQILNDNNYFEYIPHSANQFPTLIKVPYHNKTIASERKSVVNSMKAWIEQFKKINLMIYSEEEQDMLYYFTMNKSIYPDIRIDLRIKPNKILEKSQEDKDGLIHGISQLAVPLLLAYDEKTHTYTLKCDNITERNLTIQRFAHDERCKTYYITTKNFIKIYEKELKNLINSFIIENPSAFITPAPQLVVVSEDKPLLRQI